MASIGVIVHFKNNFLAKQQTKMTEKAKKYGQTNRRTHKMTKTNERNSHILKATPFKREAYMQMNSKMISLKCSKFSDRFDIIYTPL